MTMSDGPETISLLPDDGWSWMEGRGLHEPNAIEYTRTDHVQTLIAEAVAAEREDLADHVSANCFSLPSGDASRSYNAGVRDAINAIRARIHADDQVVLEARDKRVRDEALREAAGKACSVCCCQDTILALIDFDAKTTTPPSHG